jgi:pyruvate-formate lyase-activating enzyme
MIKALVADEKGKIYDVPHFEMTGRSGDLYREALPEEMIPFPEQAEFSFMPSHVPVLKKKNGPFEVCKAHPENGFDIFPAAAVLPVGYLRTLLPASAPASEKNYLPQWAYAAVGVKQDQWLCAAIRIEDTCDRWNNPYFNTPDLKSKIKDRLARSPKNRVLQQLALCSAEYHCTTAQNIFYERWEGALPVSPVCNAQCVGCISLQPEDLPPSSHQRIAFSPSVDEIVEIMLAHLEKAPEPILSFGQGCEGEPLMSAGKIEKAIRAARLETQKGTINLNTNASRPESFKSLCEAGLEAVRISTNSAIKETYEKYYQPSGYTFEDVVRTAEIARDYGLATSINLLTFPGVTDREEETEALISFIRRTQVKAIQWRNLAIDPDQYLAALPKRKGDVLGIPRLLALLKKEFPKLKHLSFSRPKEFFKSSPVGQ